MKKLFLTAAACVSAFMPTSVLAQQIDPVSYEMGINYGASMAYCLLWEHGHLTTGFVDHMNSRASERIRPRTINDLRENFPNCPGLK